MTARKTYPGGKRRPATDGGREARVLIRAWLIRECEAIFAPAPATVGMAATLRATAPGDSLPVGAHAAVIRDGGGLPKHRREIDRLVSGEWRLTGTWRARFADQG